MLAVSSPSSALMVSSAASLRDVVTAIGQEFQDTTGRRVSYNFAGSGALARQIEQGAPVDVFVSAGWAQIERLQRRDLVAGEPRVLARNRLVVIIPSESRWRGRPVESLLRAEEVVRIATGDPELVPFGAYAKRALEVAGLWDVVAAKVVFASNVRQALAYADRGAVDAAIVYGTDARVAKRAVTLGVLPGSEGIKIEAVAVKLRRSDDPESDRFLTALTADHARALFARHGFLGVDP